MDSKAMIAIAVAVALAIAAYFILGPADVEAPRTAAPEATKEAPPPPPN